MDAIIDYRKAVDTLDEGIMALNLFKATRQFPNDLREEIIRILHFLKLADKPDYQELLYDKRITISKEKLTSIHEKIKDLKFPIDEITIAICLINKTSERGGLENEEIVKLEKYLLEFSHPLWVTSISKG